MNTIAWIFAPFIMLMIRIDEYKLPPDEIVWGIVWQIGYWIIVGGIVWELWRGK